ncbi:MAG: flagellar hook basal-body protein [Sphingomonadales bacterium]|nr:flagellar hook basal-body protein [Sphingomonadales bacterium]
MSGALEVAAIGMRAQQRALEVVAGNISNINTPTYKRMDMRFAELIGHGPSDDVQASTVPGRDSVLGVFSWSLPSFDEQGRIDATGNATDIAIDGSGFIELLGPAGTTRLWRGGTLRVMDDGALATSAGQLLKASITVPTDASAIRIDGAGKVFVSQPGIDGEAEIGRIELVRVLDPTAIERLDGGLYALRDDRGVLVGTPGEEGFGSIVQGSMERSNVDLNAEMVTLLIAQRGYAANAQVARAADEFYGIANGLRR